MVSFKNQTIPVPEEYAGMGANTVYVESADDKFLIGTKWFSRFKDRIHFVSVSDSDSRNDGGCQKVLNRVEEAQDNGLRAYGIVDRDVLLSSPDFYDSIWWEVDDEVFANAKPYGESIFVLHRWELENYLLFPEALVQLHKDKFRNVPPSLSPQEIAELLIENEEDFIAVSLFSTLHHALNVPGKKQANLRHSQQRTGADLRDAVIAETQSDIREFENHVSQIKKFAEDERDAIARWERLSRLLDGKRISHRIERLIFENKFTVQDEMGILGTYIVNHDLVDPKLTTWLEGIARNP